MSGIWFTLMWDQLKSEMFSCISFTSSSSQFVETLSLLLIISSNFLKLSILTNEAVGWSEVHWVISSRDSSQAANDFILVSSLYLYSFFVIIISSANIHHSFSSFPPLLSFQESSRVWLLWISCSTVVICFHFSALIMSSKYSILFTNVSESLSLCSS